MATVKEISKVLEEEEALRLVTQVYGELAATKLQKIRTDSERSRIFFNEISKVFSQVEAAAQLKGISLPETVLGTACLLITSNSRFYGEIENDLIKYFLEENSKIDADYFLIGKTAQDYFNLSRSRPRDVHVIFHRGTPTPEEMRQLVERLRKYKKILVFYPKFESVLSQKPTFVDLTRRAVRPKPDKKNQIDFIFEPEIFKMLQFFDYQMISVLLSQVFMEADLARTGARLISMEQAQSKADDEIKKAQIQLAAAKKSEDNEELLDTISSLTGWRRKRLNND